MVFTPLSFFGQGGFAHVQAVDTNSALQGLKDTAGEAGLLSQKDPIQVAGIIVRFLLGFLGLIFIILLLYGGFLRMTARGNTSQVEQSTKIITSAIIGVIIILASYIITAFVLSQIESSVGAGGGTDSGYPVSGDPRGGFRGTNEYQSCSVNYPGYSASCIETCPNGCFSGYWYECGGFGCCCP